MLEYWILVRIWDPTEHLFEVIKSENVADGCSPIENGDRTTFLPVNIYLQQKQLFIYILYIYMYIYYVYTMCIHCIYYIIYIYMVAPPRAHLRGRESITYQVWC